MIALNRFAAIATGTLALVVSMHAGSQLSPEPRQDNAAIDRIFTAWDAPGSPGCGLAVAQDGDLLYSRGYGYANLDYDIPISPATVFDVASVTKQFIAASLSMLALEGRLSLDDDVRLWLPELPAYEWPVTLRQMINHTSGLRDYLTLFPLAGRDDYYPISHAQILAMMSRQRALNFPPGDQYSYSNTAYMLLAQVVERASGQSLGSFTQERIFGPLSMHGSLMYDNREAIIPQRAIGYDRDGDGGYRIVHNYNFDVAGDGQLYSTLEDLLRWDNYLHGADQPAIHAMMLTEGALNSGEATAYAQGLELGEYRGQRIVGHSGSSWGFRTQLVRFLDPGLAIAISCNADFADPWQLVERVADHFLAKALGPRNDSADSESDQQVTDRRPQRPVMTPAQLAPFAGTYYSMELDAIYRFTVEGGALKVRIEQEQAVPVRPLTDDQFEFELHPSGWSGPADIRLEFERNAIGTVTGFLLSTGQERDLSFVRTQLGSDEPGPMVIVNARVIDGSGGASQYFNVRIEGDRIVAVGDFQPSSSDQRIDAEGLVLAPGFIDTHSHHEDGLFEMPAALAAVNQGVTTIVAGQDGSQPYPLAEFFARLEATPVAINVASYAGHGTLRGLVMGEDYRRFSSKQELAGMAELLDREMQAGALGFATGLEYDPGSWSSTEEVVDLAKVAAFYGGGYMSHIRSEDQFFWEAIDEAITIGVEAQIPVRVTHIKLAMSRWWGQAERLKRILDEARASGIDITADIYPYRAWNTSFMWLETVFPDRDLTRREGAAYILNDMLTPEGVLIASYTPEPAYSGMTVAQIAALRESDPETTLMELLQAERALADDAVASDLLGFGMDETDIEALMAWPHTVIASDGELNGSHPRGFNAFSRFLGHYVRARQVLSLEEGVRRISALPAAQVGIHERGLIQPGYYADLVLFDPETVGDNATFERPHELSSGIKKVWVNGQLVFADGQITGKRPGQPIRRSSP